MPANRHEQHLPRVEEADLLGLVTEEVIDPRHEAWWEQFATENPTLAQQILRRAYYDTHHDEPPSSLEIQRLIIDSVSFAVRALHVAAQRIAYEKQAASAKSETPAT